MRVVIREATTADLAWVNTNDQDWTINEDDLAHALGLYVAEDEHCVPLGWMYVVNMLDHATLQYLYIEPHHRRPRPSRAPVHHLRH